VKALAVFLIVGILIGCSSTPLELPTCEIPGPMAEVGHPITVPNMPTEQSATDTTATFDLEGLLQFDRVHEAGLTNAKIAKENALAIEARNEEVNQLIECARYSKIWMEVREDMLKQERKNHMFDNMWHRGLIALGVIGAVL